MGRAERRKAERRERIEERKGKVLMSRSEIHEMNENVAGKVNDHTVQILMVAIGLAEHRLYGFGQTRIMRTLRYIDQLMGDLNSKYTLEDYLQMLSDEAKVNITL